MVSSGGGRAVLGPVVVIVALATIVVVLAMVVSVAVVALVVSVAVVVVGPKRLQSIGVAPLSIPLTLHSSPNQVAERGYQEEIVVILIAVY